MSHENDQLVRPRIHAGWTTGLLLLIVSVSSQWWATGYSQEEQTSPIRLLRHPYLQKGTGHSMGIAWMIDDDQPCSVEYGLTRELGHVVQSGKSQRMHFVEITGLDGERSNNLFDNLSTDRSQVFVVNAQDLLHRTIGTLHETKVSRLDRRATLRIGDETVEEDVLTCQEFT